MDPEDPLAEDPTGEWFIYTGTTTEDDAASEWALLHNRLETDNDCRTVSRAIALILAAMWWWWEWEEDTMRLKWDEIMQVYKPDLSEDENIDNLDMLLAEGFEYWINAEPEEGAVTSMPIAYYDMDYLSAVLEFVAKYEPSTPGRGDMGIADLKGILTDRLQSWPDDDLRVWGAPDPAAWIGRPANQEDNVDSESLPVERCLEILSQYKELSLFLSREEESKVFMHFDHIQFYSALEGESVAARVKNFISYDKYNMPNVEQSAELKETITPTFDEFGVLDNNAFEDGMSPKQRQYISPRKIVEIGLPPDDGQKKKKKKPGGRPPVRRKPGGRPPVTLPFTVAIRRKRRELASTGSRRARTKINKEIRELIQGNKTVTKIRNLRRRIAAGGERTRVHRQLDKAIKSLPPKLRRQLPPEDGGYRRAPSSFRPS